MMLLIRSRHALTGELLAAELAGNLEAIGRSIDQTELTEDAVEALRQVRKLIATTTNVLESKID